MWPNPRHRFPFPTSRPPWKRKRETLGFCALFVLLNCQSQLGSFGTTVLKLRRHAAERSKRIHLEARTLEKQAGAFGSADGVGGFPLRPEARAKGKPDGGSGLRASWKPGGFFPAVRRDVWAARQRRPTRVERVCFASQRAKQMNTQVSSTLFKCLIQRTYQSGSKPPWGITEGPQDGLQSSDCRARCLHRAVVQPVQRRGEDTAPYLCSPRSSCVCSASHGFFSQRSNYPCWPAAICL